MKEYNYLFTGYIMSYLTDKDITEWADHKILQNEYNDPIIELSLAGNQHMIVSQLKRLCDETTSFTEFGSQYLSLYQTINSKKALHWSEIGEEICKLYKNEFISASAIDDKDDFLARIFEYYALIKDGCTGNMKMPEELNQFLASYNEDIQIFKDLKFKIRNIDVFAL